MSDKLLKVLSGDRLIVVYIALVVTLALILQETGSG